MYDNTDIEFAPPGNRGAARPHHAFQDQQFVVVSNRQPYRHEVSEDGDGYTVDRPTGGLTAGLDPVMQDLGGTWIAWGDGDGDRAVVDASDTVEVPPEDPAYSLRRVWLTDRQVENYYLGFSNRVLWPLCHSTLSNVDDDPNFWRAYSRTNRQFADVVAEEAGDRSVVWLQDYHLSLAPRMIRQQLGRQPTLLQFWHIPWPGWDTFRACPHGREILGGLLGNDVLGFHVPRYRENFLECVDSAQLEATVDWSEKAVVHDGTRTRVRAIPMGVPYEEIAGIARSQTAGDFWSFRRDHDIDAETRIAVGVDRLDYSKGILARLRALEHVWENHPEWRGSLTYVQNASESRSEIDAYQRVQDDVVDAVERINDRFGTDDWRPVVYFTDHVPREELYCLYRHADLGIVSPIRDGMNLVAQEYVAAQVDADGALVLSDQTGSHDLLGDFALSISPFDVEGFANTIVRGLTLPAEERQSRMARLRTLVAENDLQSWLDRNLAAAESVRKAQSTGAHHDYR